MTTKFEFNKKEYSIKIDHRKIDNETHYFIDIFLNNIKIKKGHFVKNNGDLYVITQSSNHTFEATEEDNNLIYALKEKLLEYLAQN